MPQAKAYRAALLHCLADPREVGIEQSHEYFEDGLLVVEDGKIARIGAAADLLPTLAADTEVVEYRDALITPGFIDTHSHYPQVGVIGSYGAQLLDWLETYTFPNEGRFSDMAHAREQADLFLGELLRNGTTTALVFGTVHKQSVDAFFEAVLVNAEDPSVRANRYALLARLRGLFLGVADISALG